MIRLRSDFAGITVRHFHAWSNGRTDKSSSRNQIYKQQWRAHAGRRHIEAPTAQESCGYAELSFEVGVHY